MPTITVPGHGDVEFPDSMSDADITAALKQIAPPPAALQHGRLAEAVHKTAAFLPMAGGIVGGALGAGAGAPTGPGAILTGAAGAGMLGGAGKGIQHLIDTALGYEQPMSFGDAALDTGKAAGGEALGAGIGAGAGEILSAAAKPLAPTLSRMATGTARRILRNTGGSLSASKPLSDEAAQEVLDIGAIKPFGTSRGAAQRVDTARATAGDTYAKIVKALEGHGVVGPEADALAQQYAAEGTAVGANSMNPAVPNAYATAADQLAGKPTVNGRLALSQAENLKRSLQDQARSAYKQMQPDELARAHEATASMMRQAVEDEIARQAPGLNPQGQAIAAQFEPVKQQTGRLIEASNVAQQGMARAANRHAFSPYDIAVGAAELAHSGNPIKTAAATLLMHELRTRGPSTAATALDFAAKRLEDPSSHLLRAVLAGGGAAAGPSALAPLIEWLQRQQQQPPQQ